MDPDEVIILASPQYPIKAHRIKYYDDQLFKAMVEKQEGKPFPYPPSVEGVGPWGAEADMDEGQKVPQHEPVPEDFEKEAFVPKGWEEELDRQEDVIDDLLGR